MPKTDVFAYSNSGLGPFLFAEIGIEPNGSSLTVLSALARNGEDPWEKAAQWAKVPRAKAVEWLAAYISRLPLLPEGIDVAHNTAARLVQLLPPPSRFESEASQDGSLSRHGWSPVMLLVGGVAIALAATIAVSLHLNTLAGRPATLSVSPPIAAGQSRAQRGSLRLAREMSQNST